MSSAAKKPDNKRIIPQLTLCGVLMLLGYIVLFCIMQAPVLWYDLRPDPIRSLFPDIFRPINQFFPDSWVNLTRGDNLALLIIPLYLIVAVLISVPLVYLLRRLPQRGLVAHSLKRPLLLRIFGFTIAAMLILLFVRGLLSSDVYNYSWYSRIWVDHGVSPYTHVPADFPPDPEGSIYWIGWPKEPAVYGPAWLMISSAFYKAGQLLGGTFSSELLSLRLLADIAHLANAWLVWSIAGLLLSRRKAEGHLSLRSRHASPLPARFHPAAASHPTPHTIGPNNSKRLGVQFAALLFYIWNPLLLIEFAASGHNDVVMLTFVLLAVWLHLKGRWPLAAASLAVAALVKLPAIVFIPGDLWLLLWTDTRSKPISRRAQALLKSVRRPGLALGAILATCIILYLPFWEGTRTLLPLVSGPANRLYLHTVQADIIQNAPGPLSTFFPGSAQSTQSEESIKRFLEDNLRTLFLALAALIALFVTWRARTTKSTLIAWGWVALAAILAQGWFWPWYVSWAIAPAAIAPSRQLRVTVLIFSITSLLLYLEEQVLASHLTFFHDWNGILISGPPLAYVITSGLLEVWRKRKTTALQTAKPGVIRPSAPVKAS